MPNFTWSSAYDIGHKQIDEEHRALFEMISELGQSLYQGQNKEAKSIALSIPKAFAKHCREEEKILRNIKFGNLEIHARNHVKYTKQFTTIIEQYDYQDIIDDKTVDQFLSDIYGLFFDFLIREDMEYKSHLEEYQKALHWIL